MKGLLSTGEVLLIDTRQHWVAALRYAIRPILIFGLVVLLAILNQWLDFDTLHFINDIINWILIIALVIAIVWLPIDLVQWWSRRYVLTNRRAMRMQGVLRKSSYDCSLEQINDILLSQSFLGRKLGYADLTLLTANSSNEAYEQLLDGPQFKKAVLDAKEAIRAGQPLAGLPDGFVVKGGTNDASIRVAAKGSDSNGEAGAVDATAVATGGVVAADVATPAMAPAPIVEEPSSPVPAAPPVEPVPTPVVEAAAPAAVPEASVTSEVIEEAETAADARGDETGSLLDAPGDPADDVTDEATDLVEDAASSPDDTATKPDAGPPTA
jgi:hypothetical protein